MQKDKIAEQLNRDWTDNEISFMPFGAVLSAPCIRNTGYWAWGSFTSHMLQLLCKYWFSFDSLCHLRSRNRCTKKYLVRQFLKKGTSSGDMKHTPRIITCHCKLNRANTLLPNRASVGHALSTRSNINYAHISIRIGENLMSYETRTNVSENSPKPLCFCAGSLSNEKYAERLISILHNPYFFHVRMNNEFNQPLR